MPDAKTCSDCGAVLPDEAERCSLCGTPVSDEAPASPDLDSSRAEATPPDADSADGTSSSSDEKDQAGVFCNDCGWKNPPEANFCSRCGHALQPVASEGDAPPGTRPAAGPSDDATNAQAPEASPAGDDGLTKRAALVVGVAVLLVAVLYGWSAWSGSQAAEDDGAESGPPPAMAGGPAGGGGSATGNDPASGDVPAVVLQVQEGDMPAGIAARTDSLQNVIETRGGRRKRLARRQLGRLFAETGLTGRAAAQQWLLAREAGDDPEAWERAGLLLYDWMTTLRQDQDRARTAQVARLTTDAYERFLQSQPDNYDARTDLAVAYLFTNNPMRGISEIRRVLDEAPDHIGARFNYGLMQRMIGRNATAVAQFERVREAAGEDSPYYEQAGQIIQQINEETGGNPQDASTPSGAGPSAGAPNS